MSHWGPQLSSMVKKRCSTQGPKLRKWNFFERNPDRGPNWPFRCLDFSFHAQRSFSEAPLMVITCVTLKQQLSWRIIKGIYGSNLQKESPLAPCVWNIQFWKCFYVPDQYSRWQIFWLFVSHQTILEKYKRCQKKLILKKSNVCWKIRKIMLGSNHRKR